MSLKIGDIIPDFIAVDGEGEEFDSSSVIRQQVTVLYFYPKNFTPACTKEACQFRDAYPDFQKWGAQVIGVSSDPVSSHHGFGARYRLPFTLLSDPQQKIRKKFKIKKHIFGVIPGRETLVIDQKRVSRYRFRQWRAAGHHQKALEIIKKIYHEK